MSFRTRVQATVALGAAGVLAAGLASMTPTAAAVGTVGPTAPVARAAATSPSCGIHVYYKKDGTRWKCSFGDDFTGTSLNTAKWKVMTSAQFNFGDRNDCFLPGNVSVSDGNLNLLARREKTTIRCARGKGTYRTSYSAGMVSSYFRFAQTYGRFEFRARFPYSEKNGLQSSAWLWPRDASGATWPVSGEIDVAEWYSQWPDRVIPYLHYSSLSTAKKTNRQCLVNRVQDWHTYLLEWAPRYLRISYDGKTCLLNTGVGAPFNKPYFMAMFHGFGLGRNAPTAATSGSTRAQYAWVRVWS